MDITLYPTSKQVVTNDIYIYDDMNFGVMNPMESSKAKYYHTIVMVNCSYLFTFVII